MGRFTLAFQKYLLLEEVVVSEKDQVLGEGVGVSVTSVWPYEFVCLLLFSGLF